MSVCCVVIVFFIQWSGESKKEEAFYGCFQGFLGACFGVEGEWSVCIAIIWGLLSFC